MTGSLIEEVRSAQDVVAGAAEATETAARLNLLTQKLQYLAHT